MNDAKQQQLPLDVVVHAKWLPNNNLLVLDVEVLETGGLPPR